MSLLLEDLARRLGRLEAIVNPPERVVAWGGRPGVDLQVGSPRDLRRAELLRRRAELRRESLQRIAALGARYRAAFAKIGASTARAFASLSGDATPAVEALRRTQASIEAIQRQRDAAGRSPMERLAATIAAQDEAHRIERARLLTDPLANAHVALELYREREESER